MAGNKNSRSRLGGKIVYTLALLLFGAILALTALKWLERVNDYAEQYELSRPANTIDAYMETLNRDLWNDGIARAVAAMPHEAQSDEEIKAFVQGKLSSGVTAVRKAGSAADSSTIHYSLRCNGAEIGEVTLVEDSSYQGKVDFDQMPWPLVSKFLPSMLEWGIKPWKVSGDSFHFDDLYNVIEITVPSDYTVLVNGTALGEEYIAETGIHYDVYEEYYKYWDYLPKKVKYRFDHAIGEIKPVVLDAYGNEVEIDPNAGDIQFIAPVEGEELQRFMDFMAAFTERYLVYTSGVKDNGLHLNELKPYLLPGADLEKRMKDAMDGLSWAHTVSISIEDYQFNNVLILTDGYSVCDVSATAKTFTYGKGEEYRTTNLKVIVFDNGNKILAESLELY